MIKEKLAELLETDITDNKLDSAIEVAKSLIEMKTGIIIGIQDVIQSVYIIDGINQYPKRPLIEIVDIFDPKTNQKIEVDIKVLDNEKALFIGNFNRHNQFYTINAKVGYDENNIPSKVLECLLLVAIEVYYELDKIKQGIESISTPDGIIRFINKHSFLVNDCIKGLKIW